MCFILTLVLAVLEECVVNRGETSMLVHAISSLVQGQYNKYTDCSIGKKVHDMMGELIGMCSYARKVLLLLLCLSSVVSHIVGRTAKYTSQYML